MKVIIVNQAIPGTTGFQGQRKASDIICLAGEPQEDPNVISSVAEVYPSLKTLSAGGILLFTQRKRWAPRSLCTFPFRHMSYESISRRAAIMQQAYKDLGMKYIF